MSIYQEIILDHYHNPRHHGSLEAPTHHGEAKNLSCGDMLVMDIRLKSGIIEKARFSGTGCAISQASASILLESVVGKSATKAASLKKKDILALIGLEFSPLRLKCALLSLETLNKTLNQESSIKN